MYSRRSNLVTRSTPYSSRVSLWRSSCSSWRRGGNMCSTFGMCSTLLWSSFQSSPRCLCCFSASRGDDCMLPHCLQITRTFEIVQGRTEMYSSICFLKQKVRAFSLQMFGISFSRSLNMSRFTFSPLISSLSLPTFGINFSSKYIHI